MFKHAIVRLPGSNFAEGLTTVDLGAPQYERVLEQHSAYCQALRECGLTLTMLEADLRHPDSTFVEDAAVITPRGAILYPTGRGQPRRRGCGDQADDREFLSAVMLQIDAPGTLDGGDICEAGDHFFLGLSHRTNEAGAVQLAVHLASQGYTSSTVDVREMTTILHLKSGISYIGDNTLVVMEEMAANPAFAGYDLDQGIG